MNPHHEKVAVSQRVTPRKEERRARRKSDFTMVTRLSDASSNSFEGASGDYADLPPKNSNEIIRLSMKTGILASVEGECSAIRRPDGRKAFSNGLNFKIKPSKKKIENKLVLHDDDKRFIALCSKEALTSASFIYRIFSCRPMLPGQKPAKKTSNSRTGLYEWAEVVGAPCAMNYTMRVWNGASYEPTYLSKRGVSSRRFIFEKASRPAGLMEQTEDNWKIEVAPNMDPCLMLLFAVIVDDLNMHDKMHVPQQSLRDVAMLVSGLVAKTSPVTHHHKTKAEPVLSRFERPFGLPSQISTIINTQQPHSNRKERRRSADAA